MSDSLKNLNRIIQQAATRYSNEFVWQDVHLTEEFKSVYADHLKRNNSDSEFFDTTAVITSPSGKYIFVPNQWFVIASYAVPVCKELFKYKELFLQVTEILGRKPDEYAKSLRDAHTVRDKEIFSLAAQEVFSDETENKTDNINKLWRFATDYSWWSGQKTIDRGDFFVSVVLNMLNLVNASQGYVADIVYAYSTDFSLNNLVKRVDFFTMDLAGGIIEIEAEEPEIKSLNHEEDFEERPNPAVTTAESGKIRIKITESKNKTIRFKG